MRRIVAVIGMVAAMGILYACGGSGSKSTGGGGGGGVTTTVAAPTIEAPKTITTQAEAAKTVDSSKTLASSFASGSAFPSLNSLVGKQAAGQSADGHKIITTVRDLQQRVTGLVDKQKSLGKQVAAAQSQNCADGGTMSFDAASDPIVISFNGCKEGYGIQSGTVSMPQAMFSGTSGTGGTLSLNLTTINYVYGGYTIKESESVENLTMAVSSFDTTANTASFSINGYATSIDYTAQTSDKQTFGSFSLSMSETTSGTLVTTNMTMTGSVSMDTFNDTTFTSIDTGSGMTFQNLVLVDAMDTSTNSNSLTINGTYAIKTIPACMDGTFIITTQTPLTTNSSGVTTGQMTVNGIVMVFNADGTVTATINNAPVIISSYENACSLSF